MITSEQDSDVVRWGLQLFEANCNALQEELSQLAVAEAPGSPHEGVGNLQAPYYSHDWLGQSMENYSYGHHNGHEEAEGTRPSSSCSSPGGMSNCGEEWSYSLELTDEYALDGEVGKRLNQMVPIPHVPRINGEIPSVDEATLDHQRLLDRLQLYQLVEFKVLGDGNCQLKSCPEIYEGYVPMSYGDYLKKMSKYMKGVRSQVLLSNLRARTIGAVEKHQTLWVNHAQHPDSSHGIPSFPSPLP
ncbi:cysteine proteinases superfamily protein [Actinidia rufa]|uniref:Cysteine proteinases superfamily protein n=1 Tax=Actinidia rufa TaxID=165716 RepID=A0A7J0HBQ9_9ERIC|nr:cysteine proteinases superfamily protein [Actinidia rufa]